MTDHQFLLTPTIWLGQGKMQLNMVAEELNFFTKWTVGQLDGDGRLECVQEIQIKGVPDPMQNTFLFHNFHGGAFEVELQNEALGKVRGKGLISEKVIAWEFRVEEIGFEGLEFYEKQDEKNYLMRAEYATADQFRTVIQGRVWQKSV